MAHFFHIRSWELDLLTVAEFDIYAAAADELLKTT